MKLFVIFSVFLISVTAYFAPSSINGDNFGELENYYRIAAGQAGKKGENLDFCFITVGFFQKSQTCGCTIISDQHVLTSARCVFDCSEKEATNVTVTFPQLSGKDLMRRVEKIYIPDGVNGMAALPAYDPTMDTPQHMIAPNNVAILKLSQPIILDPKKVTTIDPLAEALTINDVIAIAKTEKYKFKACGIGSIDNKGGKPKGVMCTDVNLAPSDKCYISTTSEVFTVPDGLACIQWSDRDNNLCAGDFGGAIYAYKTNEKGEVTTQKGFCIAVGSPDVRQRALCLDGHTVFCQFLSLEVRTWAAQIYIASTTLRRSSAVREKI